MILTIISSILGSAGLFTLIQFLINRKDKRHDLLIKIDKKMCTLEKDGCRTQLLLLIKDFPTNENEIMTLAEHYFKDLKGDWYMSTMFAAWIRDREISKPFWFIEH